MIIKVLIETNNRHFILQTQRFEYELGYFYFSLNEYSITLYYSKDIVEKNGEYVPIGKKTLLKRMVSMCRLETEKLSVYFQMNSLL